MRHAIALAAILAACAPHTLSPEDVTSTREAQYAALRIYQLDGATSGPGSLARVAYCASRSVLDRNDAGPSEDPAIVCGARKP